jgi:hypothetical protein
LSRKLEISSTGDWLGWDHPILRLGLRRLSRFRGFIRLRHWDLLGTSCELGRLLCSLAVLVGSCHLTPCRGFSDWGGRGGETAG